VADDISNVILKGDPNALIKAFDAGAARAKKFDSEMKSVTNTIQGQWRSLTAMVAAPLTVVGLISIARQSLETMDRLDELSEKIGVGTEMLQVFEYQAKLSGLGGEELAAALGKLSKNMFEASSGGGSAGDAFKALGLNVKDADGKLKSTDQMLLEIADKFSKTEDGVAKTGLAMQLFGRSGKELIPFLNQGKEGIDSIHQEMEQLGILMDEKTIKLAAQVNDQFDKIGMAAKGLALNIMGELLPSLDNGSKALLQITKDEELVKSWAQNISIFLKGVASAAVGVAAAFDIMGTAIGESLARGQQFINKITQGGKKDVYNSMFLRPENFAEQAKEFNSMFTGKFWQDLSEGDKSKLNKKIESYSDIIKGFWDVTNKASAKSAAGSANAKSSLVMPLTGDQQKAIDDWEKRMIGVRSEIEKNQYDMDGYFKSLIDIKKKYDETVADAQRTMKEKNITLDLTPVEQLKQVSELKALQDFRKRIDDEINKEALKGAQDRATIMLDNETYINTRLKQDWENRVEEEKRTAGLQYANLTKLLILGKINQEDYWKNIEALEKASGKRQLDIIDEKNRNILEAETSHRIAMLNAAEKNMDMPQYQASAGRAAAYQTLIQSYTADLQKANDAGDKLIALNLQAKIDEANAKLLEENMILREQGGIFSEGLIWGVKEYAYTMKTEFQYGKELVKDTAAEMKDSFKSSLDDMQDSTFDLEDSIINMCKKVTSVFNDMCADMLINWLYTGDAMKKASSGDTGGIIGSAIGWVANLFKPSASGYCTGVGDWTLGLSFHRGGMPYEPTFTRPLPPWTFMNADRAHTGIGPRERGVVITDEEGIFTPGQMKAMGLMANRGAMNVKIELKNESGIQLEQDEQPEIRFDFENMVITTIIRRARSDRKFRETLRGGKTY
jgi:hypothetical protein